MDRHAIYHETLQPPEGLPTGTTTVASLLALYTLHQLLVYLDYPLLSIPELLWNALVSIVPTRLVLDSAKRQELRANGMLSQTHAAKSEALRRMMGLASTALTHKLSGGEGIMRKMSVFGAAEESTSDAPPGLGNWDNSCYQNSVLQGLASLRSMQTYLRRAVEGSEEGGSSTSASLEETIAKLNDPINNGEQLWTPAKLKSMSSWQQQDAQEYFSKIMDELEKDMAGRATTLKQAAGLKAISASNAQCTAQDQGYQSHCGDTFRNPMDGLLAQKVACTQCGFTEGLSMIPFNCLTVPLGSSMQCNLQDCLSEYTKMEEISDVRCSKCTLLQSESRLQQMAHTTESTSQSELQEQRNADSETASAATKFSSLPAEMREMVLKRLRAVQQALEDDDFSDKTLNEVCQIPKKFHVSSTKTRQAVIGRAPHSLVVHVNRSVFDELTGVQRKNYASVHYPFTLNLDPWMLSDRRSTGGLSSLLDNEYGGGPMYRLKSVVTHYGRHENGHYICYRQHPARIPEVDEKSSVQKWWRLSDEDVSPVTEEDVLAQHGVFMLFYERIEGEPLIAEPMPSAVTPIKQHADSPSAVEVSESDNDEDPSDTIANVTNLPASDDLKGPKLRPEVIQAEEALKACSASETSDHQPTVTSKTAEQSPPSTKAGHKAKPVASAETAEDGLVAPLSSRSTPPLMRTARGRQTSRKTSLGDGGFANSFRPMATT